MESGPIGVMLADHRFGRSCLGAIRDSLPAAPHGDSDAIRQFHDPSNPRIAPGIRRRYEQLVEQMEAVSATAPPR